MSEQLPKQSHESESNSETDKSTFELSRKNIEKIKELAEKEKSPDAKALESLKDAVETAAISKESVVVETQENKRLPDFDQGSLKRNSFNKTMTKVQAQLHPTERALSKFMHNKTIETVSEVGGKTVARPSGVLGGGIAAAVGSMAVLFYSKHFGFEYNYSLFILLYVLGFFAGVVFEMVLARAQRSKR